MNHSIDFTQNPAYSKGFFGFWLYLLTDCIMFGAIFATYVVLQNNTYGGPSARELFYLPHALGETIVLLTSSLFAGLGRVELFRNRRKRAMVLFFFAFLFGFFFLMMTYLESAHLVARGYNWQMSAFLSAFFTVIWTHALHVLAGLIWILILLAQLWFKGITPMTFKRLSCFTLFWQFLSVIWIFTFTIVYLLGAAAA